MDFEGLGTGVQLRLKSLADLNGGELQASNGVGPNICVTRDKVGVFIRIPQKPSIEAQATSAMARRERSLKRVWMITSMLRLTLVQKTRIFPEE